MNEIEQSLSGNKNGNGVHAVAEVVAIPVANDEAGPTVFEAESVLVMVEDEGLVAEETAVTAEFDRLYAITRFLVGGALEGTDELSRRLEVWEAYLREEMPENSAPLADASERELLRYALIGFIFESQDTGRSILKTLLKMPGGVARTAVRPTKSIINGRLAGPVRRRLDRMADRGEGQLMRWIERGYAEEPFSRGLARLGVAEITDEFINQLAQNEELKELVQEQSMGLAGEAVDQVRERTFSADTLVERIVRAVTRRNPRLEPPSADLSDYQGNKSFFQDDDSR